MVSVKPGPAHGPLVAILWLLSISCPAQDVADAAADEPAKVEVRVDGLEGDLREAVLGSLKIEQQRTHSRLTDGRIRALHRRAETEIREALAAFGYYQPEIESSLSVDQRPWVASYRVSPGKPVQVAAVSVVISGEGQDDQKLTANAKSFPMNAGDPFEHESYEVGKRRLARRAAELGYFEANFNRHQVFVDRQQGTADVRLELASGPRYRFGEVLFPDTVLEQERLLRYATFQEGDYYAANDVLALQNRLEGSGYFEQVIVEPDIDAGRLDPQKRVPVTVQLTPRKRHRYTVGGGYGTDTGARARAGWQNRYVNQHGHRMRADLTLSEIKRGLGASYQIPFGELATDLWDFNITGLDENTDSRDSQTLRFSAGRTTLRWGFDETLSLTLAAEEFSAGGAERETTVLLYPGATWSRTWADNPVYTRRGIRVGLTIRGGFEDALSDVSFFQAQLDGKYIHSIGEQGRVILRAEVGTTTVSDFRQFPTSLRFFAGGDNNLRGFDFEELGPKNARGEVVGGKHLVLGSVEYEHRVYGDWSVAAFADFGNAFDDFADDLAYSTGVGVRWLSPIGLVRVDLASAISESGAPLRLHINIGPDL